MFIPVAANTTPHLRCFARNGVSLTVFDDALSSVRQQEQFEACTHPGDSVGCKDAVRTVLDSLLQRNYDGARIGNTLTFLSDGAMVELEAIANADRTWAATVVQSTWRMHGQRSAYRSLRRYVYGTTLTPLSLSAWCFLLA